MGVGWETVVRESFFQVLVLSKVMRKYIRVNLEGWGGESVCKGFGVRDLQMNRVEVREDIEDEEIVQVVVGGVGGWVGFLVDILQVLIGYGLREFCRVIIVFIFCF